MELAQAIVEAASRRDRDDLIKVAESIVARTDARACAELSWAILTVIAELQAKTTPPRRITWRPTQLKRRRNFSFATASH
jgi:hypothetical protein